MCACDPTGNYSRRCKTVSRLLAVTKKRDKNVKNLPKNKAMADNDIVRLYYTH